MFIKNYVFRVIKHCFKEYNFFKIGHFKICHIWFFEFAERQKVNRKNRRNPKYCLAKDLEKKASMSLFQIAVLIQNSYETPRFRG